MDPDRYTVSPDELEVVKALDVVAAVFGVVACVMVKVEHHNVGNSVLVDEPDEIVDRLNPDIAGRRRPDVVNPDFYASCFVQLVSALAYAWAVDYTEPGRIALLLQKLGFYPAFGFRP